MNNLQKTNIVQKWFECVNSNKQKLVARFLEDKSIIDVKDNRGATAIYCAVEKRHFFLAMYLLRHGANVNITCTETQATPLVCAVKQEDEIMVHILLNHGAKLHFRSTLWPNMKSFKNAVLSFPNFF